MSFPVETVPQCLDDAVQSRTFLSINGEDVPIVYLQTDLVSTASFVDKVAGILLSEVLGFEVRRSTLLTTGDVSSYESLFSCQLEDDSTNPGYFATDCSIKRSDYPGAMYYSENWLSAVTSDSGDSIMADDPNVSTVLDLGTLGYSGITWYGINGETVEAAAAENNYLELYRFWYKSTYHSSYAYFTPPHLIEATGVTPLTTCSGEVGYADWVADNYDLGFKCIGNTGWFVSQSCFDFVTEPYVDDPTECDGITDSTELADCTAARTAKAQKLTDMTNCLFSSSPTASEETACAGVFDIEELFTTTGNLDASHPQGNGGLGAKCIPLVRYDGWPYLDKVVNSDMILMYAMLSLTPAFNLIVSNPSFTVLFDWYTPDPNLMASGLTVTKVKGPPEFQLDDDYIFKSVWSGLRTYAPAAVQFFQNMIFPAVTMSDIESQLLEKMLNSSYTGSISEIAAVGDEVACNFVKTMKDDIWASWTQTYCLAGYYFNSTLNLCSECPGGTYAEAGGVSACTVCPAGTFASGGASQCVECAPGFYSATEKTSQCSRCPTGQFAVDSGSTSCVNCPFNLSTLTAGAISVEECSCPVGQQWSNKRRSCIDCTEGLSCVGGLELPQILTGYWSPALDDTPSRRRRRLDSDSDLTDDEKTILELFPVTTSSEGEDLGIPSEHLDDGIQVFECRYTNFCPGGAPGSCFTHRGGIACGRCASGYYQPSDDDPTCTLCSQGDTYGMFFVLILIALLYVGVIYRLASSPYARKILPTAMISTSISLMSSLAQNVSVLETMSVAWPSALQSFFSVFKVFLFDLQVFKIGCSEPRGFVTSYIFNISLPFMLAIALWSLYVFFHFFGPALQSYFNPPASPISSNNNDSINNKIIKQNEFDNDKNNNSSAILETTNVESLPRSPDLYYLSDRQGDKDDISPFNFNLDFTTNINNFNENNVNSNDHNLKFVNISNAHITSLEIHNISTSDIGVDSPNDVISIHSSTAQQQKQTTSVKISRSSIDSDDDEYPHHHQQQEQEQTQQQKTVEHHHLDNPVPMIITDSRLANRRVTNSRGILVQDPNFHSFQLSRFNTKDIDDVSVSSTQSFASRLTISAQRAGVNIASRLEIEEKEEKGCWAKVSGFLFRIKDQWRKLFTGKMDLDFTINAMGQVTNLMYTGMVKQAIAPFDCYQHPNGLSSNTNKPALLCYESDWYQVLPFCIFGIIFYIVGINLVVAYFVLRLPKLVRNNPRIIHRCRFLIARFRSQTYRWNIVIFLRNTLFTLPSVLFPNKRPYQVTFMSFVSALYLMFIWYYMPWSDRLNNRLDGIIMFALLLILIIGGVVPSDGSDPTMTRVLGSLMTIILAVNMAYAILAIAKQILSIFRPPVDEEKKKRKQFARAMMMSNDLQRLSTISTRKLFDFIGNLNFVEKDTVVKALDTMVADLVGIGNDNTTGNGHSSNGRASISKRSNPYDTSLLNVRGKMLNLMTIDSSNFNTTANDSNQHSFNSKRKAISKPLYVDPRQLSKLSQSIAETRADGLPEENPDAELLANNENDPSFVLNDLMAQLYYKKYIEADSNSNSRRSKRSTSKREASKDAPNDTINQSSLVVDADEEKPEVKDEHDKRMLLFNTSPQDDELFGNINLDHLTTNINDLPEGLELTAHDSNTDADQIPNLTEAAMFNKQLNEPQRYTPNNLKLERDIDEWSLPSDAFGDEEDSNDEGNEEDD